MADEANMNNNPSDEEKEKEVEEESSPSTNQENDPHQQQQLEGPPSPTIEESSSLRKDRGESTHTTSRNGDPQQPPKEKEGEEEKEERAQASFEEVQEDQKGVDLLRDPLDERTYGRRIASWFARHYPTLYGLTPSPYKPSVETAWIFFEHTTLERYIVDENDAAIAAARSAAGISKQEQFKRLFHRGERQLHIAEPGEATFRTKLYSPLTTPLSQLGDFGLGFGIYFATLRDLAFLILLGGILSIPNIVYFASDEYSTGQNDLSVLLRGSAICLDRSWVACPTCAQRDFDSAAAGTYKVERFVLGPWDAIRNEQGRGFYWNVTEYLNWADGSPSSRAGEDAILLDGLISTTIPEESRISLSATGGYLLDGVNITERLGYTPLWCGYEAISDCYLDLYPLIEYKHKKGLDPEEVLATVTNIRPGDVDFVQTGFALKNNCDGATRNQGFINYGTILVLMFGTIYAWFRFKRIEIAFDEDEQTAQDYSVAVRNPPPDASDPNEWKVFFERALQIDAEKGAKVSNPKVTVCTIDVDNEVLLGYLIQRREILQEIQLVLPPEAEITHENIAREAAKAGFKKICGFLPSSKLPAMFRRLLDVERQIKEYFEVTKERPATAHVFLTFETEAAQRQVLSQSSVGSMKAKRNDVSSVPKHYLFRGKHVLDLREPDEPSSIRWQELDTTVTSVYARKAFTSLATFGFVTVAFYIIQALYNSGQAWIASIVTTIFTSAFGTVAKVLMGFEKHKSETSRQKWLFVKVAAFNILVTTVLLALITPFQATLDPAEKSLQGLLPAVSKLFWSQITVAPVLQILDIGGNIQRHILAPRAKTQVEMNMFMRGTPVNLAERFAQMIKFLFMTLWYCSVYPGVFFLGSLALIITYFVDRFSLMRSWSRSAQVGAEIADFARNLFIPCAICLMSVVSAYFWSGFPYDNLCLDENATLPGYYNGDYNLTLGANNFVVFGIPVYQAGGDPILVSVTPDDEVYKFCNQDLRAYTDLSFPALPGYQPEGAEWMTAEQEKVVSAHGWTSLVVLMVFVLFISAAVVIALRRRFFSGYVPRGSNQNIDYSDVDAIGSYIPQISSPLTMYPLLLCCTKDIDKQHFNWEDKDHPHSAYEITRDVAKILGTNDEHSEFFAQVKHWPKPKSAQTVIDESAEEQHDTGDESVVLHGQKILQVATL